MNVVMLLVMKLYNKMSMREYDNLFTYLIYELINPHEVIFYLSLKKKQRTNHK